MNLLINESSQLLWQEVIKEAEQACAVKLKQDLEGYLVSLLVRYTNQPDIVKQVLATAFLEALQLEKYQRTASLQCVGDQCLLFAGLFPHSAQRRRVKISYFVELGQAAYSHLSGSDNDLYNSLAAQFVLLMDILQSIRQTSDLLPLEAYELWSEVKSQRALRILQSYTKAIPFS
jgi:hypothetical protein